MFWINKNYTYCTGNCNLCDNVIILPFYSVSNCHHEIVPLFICETCFTGKLAIDYLRPIKFPIQLNKNFILIKIWPQRFRICLICNMVRGHYSLFISSKSNSLNVCVNCLRENMFLVLDYFLPVNIRTTELFQIFVQSGFHISPSELCDTERQKIENKYSVIKNSLNLPNVLVGIVIEYYYL